MRRAVETAANINHDKAVSAADLGLVGADFGPCPGTERSYYNGDGLRVRRLMWDNPGTGLRKTTEDYTWDVSGGLPQILQETRTVGTGAAETVSYVYGLGLISVTDGSGTYYPLTDGLGSTVEVRDSAGVRTESYVYDVFGALRSPEPSGAKTDRRFTGEQADVPVLRSPYYLRARHYDPGLGRFVQKDPVLGVNRYQYAYLDPVNLRDPAGLFPGKGLGKRLLWHGRDAVSAGANVTQAAWDQAVDKIGGAQVNLLYNIGALEFSTFHACKQAFAGFDQCASNAVQLYSLIPGAPGGWVTQAGSLAAGMYQVWTSSCSTKQKVGLSIVETANGVLAVGGVRLKGLASDQAGRNVIDATNVGRGATFFGSTTVAASRCGDDPKEAQ